MSTKEIYEIGEVPPVGRQEPADLLSLRESDGCLVNAREDRVPDRRARRPTQSAHIRRVRPLGRR